MNTDLQQGLHCRRCESPLEVEDLRCPICALPAPVVQADAIPVSARAEILRCDSCGAAVAYDVELRAPRCSFCRSKMHIETPEDPIEEAEAFLPFTVRGDKARSALKKWLGSLGFFRPSDLASAATIDTIQPLYWAGWSVDAESTVSWAADSGTGSRRASWAPHSGQQPLHFDGFVVSASRGLNRKEIAGLWGHYNLASAQAGPPDDSRSAQIERFDMPRSAARRVIDKTIRSYATGVAKSNWIPGNTHRKVKVEVLLKKLSTRRLALPAYVMAYRYNKELYRTVICGQNSEIVIGKAPVSYLKVALVTAAALLAAGGILWLVLQ